MGDWRKNNWILALISIGALCMIGLLPLASYYLRQRQDVIISGQVTRFPLVESVAGERETRFDIFRDRLTGQEIVCVHGRLASAPSCYLSGRILPEKGK